MLDILFVRVSGSGESRSVDAATEKGAPGAREGKENIELYD